MRQLVLRGIKNDEDENFFGIVGWRCCFYVNFICYC